VGLATRAQAPPSGAENTTVFSQAGREEAQGRAGNVDAGRVDKHTKPLMETVLLVENLSTRGFTRPSGQLAIQQVRLAAQVRPVTYVFDYVFLLTPREGSVGRITP
jgi:hypothetical protein